MKNLVMTVEGVLLPSKPAVATRDRDRSWSEGNGKETAKGTRAAAESLRVKEGKKPEDVLLRA
jgi:hypothetical protein